MFETKSALRSHLLERYEDSAAERFADDCDLAPVPTGYKCRRCGKECGLDEGSTDLAGLCDDCWVEADMRLRTPWSER